MWQYKLTLFFFLNWKDVAPPSYDEAVKRQTEKASKSSDKEPRHKREKEHFRCDDDKTGHEEGEAEESSSCDEDDVWATEDEDNYDNENDTDSSEDEYNANCMVSAGKHT